MSGFATIEDMMDLVTAHAKQWETENLEAAIQDCKENSDMDDEELKAAFPHAYDKELFRQQVIQSVIQMVNAMNVGAAYDRISS